MERKRIKKHFSLTMVPFPLTAMLINVPMNASGWNPLIPFTEILSLVNDDNHRKLKQNTYLVKKIQEEGNHAMVIYIILLTL